MATQVLKTSWWMANINNIGQMGTLKDKKQSNQKQWSFKGHKTLSDDYSHDLDWWRPPHFSVESCHCNQHIPGNMLVIQSTNKRVSGWTWLFPMVHVWHLGGGVWGEAGGPLDTRGSGWVQNEMREARKGERRETVHSVTNTVSFCRLSLNWSSHISLWHHLFFPSTNLPPPLHFVVLFL